MRPGLPGQSPGGLWSDPAATRMQQGFHQPVSRATPGLYPGDTFVIPGLDHAETAFRQYKDCRGPEKKTCLKNGYDIYRILCIFTASAAGHYMTSQRQRLDRASLKPCYFMSE